MRKFDKSDVAFYACLAVFLVCGLLSVVMSFILEQRQRDDIRQLQRRELRELRQEIEQAIQQPQSRPVAP